jgi:hypothetical protein
MRVGIIGLGRMGANLALSAIGHGHEVVGHDRDAHVMDAVAHEGIEPAASLDHLVGLLSPVRIVLIYLPHGVPTERACEALRDLLAAGDVVVDSGTRRTGRQVAGRLHRGRRRSRVGAGPPSGRGDRADPVPHDRVGGRRHGVPLARALAEASASELDRAGRVTVEPDLTLPGRSGGVPGVVHLARRASAVPRRLREPRRRARVLGVQLLHARPRRPPDHALLT